MKNISGKVRNGMLAGLIVSLVFVALFPQVFNVPLEQNEDGTWQVVHKVYFGAGAQAGEAIASGITSGFLEIIIINNSDPAEYEGENSSALLENWTAVHGLGWASADNFNIEIAHQTTFDIIVRARWNKTHAWNGTAFIDTDTRCSINITGAVTIAGTMGTHDATRNDTSDNFIWINSFKYFFL